METIYRFTGTCRICGEHGHKGNQCPQWVKPSVVLTPRMIRPPVPTLDMLPGHPEQQRKPKVPTAAMMVNGSVKRALEERRCVEVRQSSQPTTSESERPTRPKVPRYMPDARTKTEGQRAGPVLGDTEVTTEGQDAGPVRGPICFRYPRRVPEINAAKMQEH